MTVGDVDAALGPGYGSSLKEVQFKPMFGFTTANQCINLHKILCIPVIVACMCVYKNFTLPALMYLFAHGTYSIMWLVKYATYPPKNFETDLTAANYIVTFFLVGLYWLTPWILCKTAFSINPILMMVSLFIYQAGIFMHYVSDCQLHYTLLYRGSGLVKTGLYARTRNPGYLGEILIYIGYALLAQHWLPWLVNCFFWFGLFRDNMNKKEKSISRHPGWQEYKAQSWQLLPKPWGPPVNGNGYIKIGS